MRIHFSAIDEPLPGPGWQEHFAGIWSGYRTWFLSEGDAARPTYLEGLRALKRHMPELVSTYETLVALAGGSDTAARFLSLYRPPPYLTGCSQAIWPGDEPLLVRNYDYEPRLAEGTLLHTAWNGRRVIAMSDCLWGVLDGINEDGLVVSLTFGGRRVVGDGFGVPIILRYILEFCTTTLEAVEVLLRVPTHMAYNVTVIDRAATFRTLYLSPDREPVVRQLPATTNHQGRVEWHAHARATATIERERYLFSRIADGDETPEGLVDAFQHPPLYNTDFSKGFGTLYTAVYWPRRAQMELRWPGHAPWAHTFDRFRDGALEVNLPLSVDRRDHPRQVAP